MAKGRLPKYTPAMHRALIEQIKKFGFVEYACDSLKLNRSTFYQWMRWGQEGLQPFDRLYVEVMQARAEKTEILQRKVESTPDGAKWMLTKMHSRFADKSAEAIAQQMLDELLPMLDDQTATRVLMALDKLYGVQREPRQLATSNEQEVSHHD